MLPKATRSLSILIAATIFALAASEAQAGSRAGQAPSNLEIMTTLTTEAVGELMTRIDGDRAGRGIRLKPYANSEDYRFVGGVITSVLTQRGVPVYQSPAAEEQAAPDDALELQFQTMEFSIVYPRVFRSHLIGGKRVRRLTNVSLVTTLVDPADGAVVRVDQVARDAEDQFSYDQRDRVEQGTLEFVRPEVPGSGWGRAVEPVFVSGIIVGLIYLFFSNQSDN